MRVLVTGAGALLGQGIIRSLRRGALNPTIVGADPSPLSAGLYWADEAELVPMASDPAYLEQMEALLRRTRPDAVLIGFNQELPHFAAARDRLEREHGLSIVVSPPDAIAIAEDKWLTALFLRDHGFAAPDSALAGDVDALVSRVGYPLVVKPRTGTRSYGVSIVGTDEELRSALEAGTDVVVQEHVGSADEEFTAGILCFGGEAAASIVIRRDLRDGNTYRAYVDDHPELHGEVRRIAVALGTHGPLNVQFRLKHGRVVPFELNARFSGTTPLRALAGFNEVEMTLRALCLGERIAQPPIRPMTILRHWSETVVDEARLAGLRSV